MIATLQTNAKSFEVDLSKPIDISISIQHGEKNLTAWEIDAPHIAAVVSGDWTGKVTEGANVNFNNIRFNPHAHGTHTECLGHITHDFFDVQDSLKTFFFFAELISIEPERQGSDLIITKMQIEKALKNKSPEAVIIRTLPNGIDKISKKYSGNNPAFLSADAAKYLREIGIKHLLIDLPSVDQEEDGGKLAAHKAFWNVKNTIMLNSDARLDASITELVFVPNDIGDGAYLLNLQIAPFSNDATPSKPILYKIKTV
ncbi:MAG: cyclase family protein [Flavobacteriaceae bacterium]|nr:cyclase family protein [Flavobacteriaceae bacterium]MDZ4146819.1 cyclase family protein [Flavobacteriaceae bacterium]